MATEFPFCKMKRVLEIDGGDGCTILSMFSFFIFLGGGGQVSLV